MKTVFYYDCLETPTGLLEVTASSDAVLSVYFVDQPHDVSRNTITSKAIEQLTEYFAGQRTCFNLPLGSQGTIFQQKVWQALTEISYGATCSYGDIANQIDNPKAVRAVGLANSKNPISVIVPCHRVIGKNGNLTGYAGGVDRKAWLLKHEGVLLT